MRMLPRACLILASLLLAGVSLPAQPQPAVEYVLSFPERVHRLMDVEIRYTGLPQGELQLRMSRSSPGRYALHEFAKNVLDVRATDPSGRALAIERPDAHGWNVSGHRGAVHVRYRVFGDRVDGTYLGIDSTHAHINMPAALMWARGLERRPVVVRFERPQGASWQVATQLLAGGDALTFRADNLAYLMDSPAEFSAFTERTFTVGGPSVGGSPPSFRVAVHHEGSAADADAFARDVRRIVAESLAVWGEFPAFEGGRYTFIADYLPWASGDGMEHRNSTILTSSAPLRTSRLGLLDTVAHEFFHAWNVERLRPRSLEPFDLERANVSGELWFGEGFTSYYAPLLMRRAGLVDTRGFVAEIGDAVNTVIGSPGRRFRSPREMSRLAPFVDAASWVDRTSFDNTFLSYYTWGAAIGLGLDLTLRDRTDGRVTLDDYMRALWRAHGRQGGKEPGTVDRPYTHDDLRAALAQVAGDEAFARDFFARYIDGRDVVDYERLLARAGIVLRKVAPGRATAGALRLQEGAGGLRVTNQVPFDSPAWRAGIDRDDVLLSAGGTTLSNVADWARMLERRKPGDTLPVTFRRRGETVSATITLVEDAGVEAVLAEDAGQAISAAQRAFRDRWLGSQARDAF